VFDPILRAPACRTVGALCDTGRLIDGRGGLGPESNSPNTIYGACPDGTLGQYHVARSIDRIRVSTEDGSALAPGKTARIELTVFACACETGPDYFSLFVARDATNPVWFPLNVVSSSMSPGRQVLSATFTVPEGKLEAVRATINFNVFPEVCAVSLGTESGTTQESDDLVFAVENEASDFVYAWPEVEGGSITKPLVVLATDPTASAGKCVRVPAGHASLTAPPADGHVTVSFSLPAARNYRVWGRAMAASSNDSFWVRVDDGAFIKWDGIAFATGWHWQLMRDADHSVQPLQLNLAAGAHHLELAYRTEGTQIDRLLITDDPLRDPAREGERPGPPRAPQHLVATLRDRMVHISWDEPDSSASEIKVLRGMAPGGPYPVRFESSRGSFDDTTAASGTRYCYVGQASNGDGDSPLSAEVCVTP
jgi:hypothetical protein